MSAAPWLLALHSSSETLAVAVQRLDADATAAQVGCFPLGRRLSNELLVCVEQALPAAQWPQIGRIVVATGPGGFTGTRLTIVLARTLAQQLAVPLHGFSSFLLMARRLAAVGQPAQGLERFWLAQELPRRGTVAGCYGPCPGSFGGLKEREIPRLFRPGEAWPGAPGGAEPCLPAVVDPREDALQLLQLGALAAQQGLPGPWQPVLPLYPTSPVENFG